MLESEHEANIFIKINAAVIRKPFFWQEINTQINKNESKVEGIVYLLKSAVFSVIMN